MRSPCATDCRCEKPEAGGHREQSGRDQRVSDRGGPHAQAEAQVSRVVMSRFNGVMDVQDDASSPSTRASVRVMS